MSNKAKSIGGAKWRWCLIAATLAPACSGSPPSGGTASVRVQSALTSPAASDDALRTAAGCAGCSITARFTTTLPLTGKTFTEAKMMSDSVGPHSVALDAAGNAVNAQALRAAEGAAKIARQGRLRDDAFALSVTAASDVVPVSIWADFSDEHLPTRAVSADVLASHEAVVHSKLQAVTSKITAWLDAHGFASYERGLSLPVITADVPTSALTELGRLDGVAFVELRHPLKPAGTGTNCSSVTFQNCSPWFNTVKLAGAQGIIPSASNQKWCNGEGWVPSSSVLPAVTIFDSTVATSAHTTWVSELVSATASSRSAPGATIYSAATGFTSDADRPYQAWNLVRDDPKRR